MNTNTENLRIKREHGARLFSNNLAGTIIEISRKEKHKWLLKSFEKQTDAHNKILNEISSLRRITYDRLYPDYTIHNESYYDKAACVIYSKNSSNEIISTARVNLGGFIPIPIHESVSNEITYCIEGNQSWGEIGRWIISPEARGQHLAYYKLFYQLSQWFNIDYYFMQVREHHKSFYQQYFKAKLLADSKGYDSVPGCTNLKWELKDTPGDFFKLIGDNTCLFTNHYDKIKHLQVENHE